MWCVVVVTFMTVQKKTRYLCNRRQITAQQICPLRLYLIQKTKTSCTNYGYYGLNQFENKKALSVIISSETVLLAVGTQATAECPPAESQLLRCRRSQRRGTLIEEGEGSTDCHVADQLATSHGLDGANWCWTSLLGLGPPSGLPRLGRKSPRRRSASDRTAASQWFERVWSICRLTLLAPIVLLCAASTHRLTCLQQLSKPAEAQPRATDEVLRNSQYLLVQTVTELERHLTSRLVAQERVHRATLKVVPWKFWAILVIVDLVASADSSVAAACGSAAGD